MKPRDVTTNPRLAGLVKRYHTWPTISQQSVGEHSWQVHRIYQELFGMVPGHVTHYILMHDMGEIAVGDPPFPVKANNKELKRAYDKLERAALSDMDRSLPLLAKEDAARIRLCHMLEMMEFGLHEMALGNQYARPIFERCQERAHELIAEMSEVALRKRALGYLRTAERRLA